MADNLQAELSEEAAQYFQHLEHQQNVFAQARLRTVEAALGTEHAQAQQNLQLQYLTQVQGLHNELQAAQRQFADSISQERAAKGQEKDAQRRELAEKNQLIRKQANGLQEKQKSIESCMRMRKLELMSFSAARVAMENPLRRVDSVVGSREARTC